MVFVNNQKFACESCIKGHRSSSCHHTDRPLFEVKRKGRPVTQCETCRELRKSKKIHSKCICNTPQKPVRPATRPLTTKYKRHIPVVPTLPNGLKDVLEAMASQPITEPADARSKVDSLLNPCTCRNTWRCKCPKEAPLPLGNLTSRSRQPTCSCSHDSSGGNCCGGENDEEAEASCCDKEDASAGSKRTSCCAGADANVQRKKKGRKPAPSPRVELPPILTASMDETSLIGSPSHDPITIPPISAITELAGSGCSCGVFCACPGCKEHRGPENAAESGHKDCAEGCGHCVNHDEVALPGTEGSKMFDAGVVMDMFRKMAASLPKPPANWKTSVELDPTDVSVYPNGGGVIQQVDGKGKGRAREEGEGEGRGRFQLVELPKLECCGGNCGCTNGRCACGSLCDGCCEHHRMDIANEDEGPRPSGSGKESVSPEAIVVEDSKAVVDSVPQVGEKVAGSCCSSRRSA